MPHLLVQTRFPAAEPRAEVTFYGSFERELLNDLQTVTGEAVESLQATYGMEPQPAGSWKSSSISPNAMYAPTARLPFVKAHVAARSSCTQGPLPADTDQDWCRADVALSTCPTQRSTGHSSRTSFKSHGT
jgi:hypothetical protein